jgi:2-polyprenyl-3-methyl-5-hydroxy-6-metoxy-1,4-benzoquinol methylase
MDQAKLEAFMGKAVCDFGAAVSVVLAHIGDKLGLYKAMANSPATSQELADRTGTTERYVREWLINQAAGGYVEYDPSTKKYTLPEEHALALADEGGPFFVGGGFQVLTAMMKAEPRITEAFKTGEGMFWGEHDHNLFEGTERFFRPGYVANLVGSWIPALDGVKEKMEKGAKVADVGCGHGASTIIMAQAFPNSRFFGFDNHCPSIERARMSAEEAGVADRVEFSCIGSTEFPGANYDLVAFFDCFHDLSDPAGAAKRAKETLAPDGVAMIVEPMAGRTVEENFNPVGRVYSGASVLCCTPNAIAGGGHALGTVATDDALQEMVAAGGFTQFRRAAETPFNRIFEAKA